MSNVCEAAKVDRVRLSVSNEQGHVRDQLLAEGNSVMIGSGANCGLRMADPGISSIHCLVRFENGELRLQDWCSKLGTYVDQQLVEDEVVVAIGAMIQIGRFQIRVEPAQANARNSSAASRPEPTPTRATEQVSRSTPTSDPAVSSETELAVESVVTESEDSTEPESKTEADVMAIEQTVAAALPAPALPPATSPRSTVPRPDPKPARSAPTTRPAPTVPSRSEIDPETVNLLRAEIECLQSELAERDRHLLELSELATLGTDACESAADPQEVDRLVGRLEDLLDELSRGDQRISALEELLCAEQELSRNQDEEKRQVEAWLGDLEQRVTGRESEWKAERDVLLKRIEQLTAERDQIDRHFQEAHQQNSGAVSERLMQELRSEVDRLQAELTESARRCAVAEAEAERASGRTMEETVQSHVDEAIRAERLALRRSEQHSRASVLNLLGVSRIPSRFVLPNIKPTRPTNDSKHCVKR